MKNYLLNKNLRITLLSFFILIFSNAQQVPGYVNNYLPFPPGHGINVTVTSYEVSKYAIQPQFQFLRFGEVKPLGWIKEQMTRDLQDGFAGRLDKLANEAGTDIFASGRNRHDKKNTANADQNHWWNGETEGNWRTGFIMLAYLSGNSDAIEQADLFDS